MCVCVCVCVASIDEEKSRRKIIVTQIHTVHPTIFTLYAGLIWFLSLMTYQPLWVIYYQSYPCIRTAVIISNPSLEDEGVHTFLKGISEKGNVIARL